MLQSYLTVMIRNMARQKIHSAISILGLTAGITFSLLMGVFIWGEMQVDQGLKDVDRLYLLETRYESTEGTMPPFFVPGLLGKEAVEQYPSIFETYYRFRDRGITVSKGDHHLRIQSMIGDSALFEMFGFPVLYGNPARALHSPNYIVITEKVARQFFDRADVVGESLTVSTEISGRKDFIVTAVIADLQKKNSVSDFMNMDAQVFISHENRTDFNLGYPYDWNSNIITYLKLTEGASPTEARTLLNKVLISDAPLAVSEKKQIEVDPLSSYYLRTNDAAVQKLIVSLTVIAFFIILLAIVNFVNLSIASSFSRLREVGVRKVIGGIKRQVVAQFLSESIVLAAFSGILSLIMYEIMHGYFGGVLSTTLPSLTELGIPFWLSVIAGTFVIGLLAGGYPSLYLAATRTIESLKGKFKPVKTTIRFSRTLIAVQFLVATFVFTTSLIMSRQVSYFMETDLGYDKSLVMVVTSVPRMWSPEGLEKMDAAKNEFLASPRISSASLSWGAPNFTFSPYSAQVNLPGRPLEEGVLTTLTAVDADYADVYGLDVIDGKFFFDAGEPFQANRLVINETAQMGLSLHVGDKVRVQYSDQEFTIAGVVRDFNFESLHKPVGPVAFTHTRDQGAFRYFSFKLNPGNIEESVRDIERKWKAVFPDDPFVYGFTEERWPVIYQTELQLKKASVIGSVLILVIVLTGVLGLVSLTVAKRSKEIGIRKVLGATATGILVLISGEYAALMAAAFVVGVPVSFIFSLRWLSGFAYHIDLTWWMFAIPIFFLFCITLIVASAQSLKTAMSNPAKALKYE